MKNLWTPWRMEYITGNKHTQECIFDVSPEETYDRENLILLRNSTTVTLMNRFPYANGHLLIAPSRHVPHLCELNTSESADLMEMVQSATAILETHLKPDGFNIGLNIGEVAGAGIADHLHFHIIPRWSGDHNFMTPLAEVRTIPEHIDRTFEKLLPDFQSLCEAANE